MGPTVPGVRVAGVTMLDDARPGMNPDIRPQDDLFGHVNGGWLDSTEIPSDRSAWGAFTALAEEAEHRVKAIIEDAPVVILLHVNEQKIHHKYVKGFQMVPAGLIDMHRVWLDRG